jgi:predicted regulator of Ras-like GTPase activity (Roadblock/LC7/MglB family)
MRKMSSKLNQFPSEPDRVLLQSELQHLLDLDPSVLVAGIASVDGFQIVHLSRDAIRETARLAPLTSSLGALGTAVGAELKAGALESVLVEAQGGRLLMTKVSLGVRTVILAIVTDKRILLGKVFALCAESSRRISAAFTV